MDICEEAVRRSLQEIAITDHYDLFQDQKYARYLNFEQLYGDIARAKEAYAGKFMVKTGIELGQPHVALKESQDFLTKYELDFMIGSVHHLEDKQDIGEN